jgi:omega-amidase
MQDLKVALVQANQIWENKKANFENYERLLTDVSADLILLPEMFQTGFSMNTKLLAEDWQKSESIEWLKSISRTKNCAIYTSLMTFDKGNYYNRGVFVTPNGEVKKYDKRKSFSLAGEHKAFKSGETETIVEYLGWKFQLQICYDLRFPEIARNYLQPNLSPAYDVLLYVANWPEKRISHWNVLLKARAIENQAYVLSVNRVGKDENGLVYSGESKIINALGESLELNKNEENVLISFLQKDKLNEVRKLLPFLSDC